MSAYHKISFCTTCKGRLHHLKQTLPINLEKNAHYPNSEFVVLDYNSADGLGEWIRSTFQNELASGRLVYARTPDPEHFRMAHAKNMAHRVASGDILVNVDADNYLGRDFAFYVNSVFQEFDSVFVHPNGKHERVRGGCGGRIGVRRADFFQVGGYDERFSGWSPDDKDLVQRLKGSGLAAHLVDTAYLDKIDHPNSDRFANLHPEDQAEDFIPRRIKAYYKQTGLTYDRVISNNGAIGLGRVFKNFSDEPVAFLPLPTRVFGIGWHKTGTTSLHGAFHRLGYRSLHWIPKLYFPLLGLDDSHPLVDRHYALCDFPIPFFFPRLDELYPNSKFILTTRSTESFVASIQNHLEISPLERDRRRKKKNKRKKAKGFPKMGGIVHHHAYGQTQFDAKVFARRFERHNQDVRDYFADRPDDLLTIDISQPEPDEQRWARVCEFLGEASVPEGPYPRSFATRERLDRLKRLGETGA